MNVPEESDSGVLPINPLNKIEQSMAESEEGMIVPTATSSKRQDLMTALGMMSSTKSAFRYSAPYPIWRGH